MVRRLSFVDTNVLAYAYDGTDRRKQAVSRSLLEELWESRSGAISTQVLQEFYAVATRKFSPPMSRRQAREVVAAFGQWHLITVDVPLIDAASRLEERHRLSFWDALIVEAAKLSGAGVLLTEDLQSGRRFADVQIQDPFA